MNVLSLFDGMSCGQIALEKAGITVDNYYASEIDKHAIKVTQRNFPNTIQLGDVKNWREWDIPWGTIDLILAGSPCQGFSFAGKGLNFNDERSKLFFDVVDIISWAQAANSQVNYLVENVRMKPESLDVFNEYLGVNPITINSALLSAQNRVRLYWTNWKVTQPEDMGITLPDVIGLAPNEFDIYQKNKLDSPRKSNLKSSCLTGTANAAGNHSQMDVIVEKGVDIPVTESGTRIDIHKNPKVRRYSVEECEMLQTVPVGYTEGVSNSQRFKMLINGWTIDVIKHLLDCGKENNWSK